MGVLAVQGFKEIWRRWKAWLAADTLSEEDLAREEVADRFRSHLAECRKAWQAAGMTEEEQKKAEETEISLILEKTESKEKNEEKEEEIPLLSSEMQAYVDTVCDQIRWKQTRKAVAEELTDHLLLQKEAFLTEGLSEEEAETRTVEEMGDGIVVGLALDRTHRPKPQWQMVLVAAVLLCMGLFCRLTIDQVSFGMGLLVPVFLAAAIFAGAYFLDFTLLARKAKWIFLLFLAMLILAVPFVEKSGGESVFFFFDYAYALTGLALLVPLPFLSMLFLTRRKGNRGYWFCWLAMAALAVVLLSFGKMSMVLMFVFFRLRRNDGSCESGLVFSGETKGKTAPDFDNGGRHCGRDDGSVWNACTAVSSELCRCARDRWGIWRRLFQISGGKHLGKLSLDGQWNHSSERNGKKCTACAFSKTGFVQQ